MRLTVMVPLAVTLSLLTGVVSAGTASAAPTDPIPGGGSSADTSGAGSGADYLDIDPTKFPASLQQYVQGTQAFADHYSNIPDKLNAIPCSRGRGGGNVEGYVDDFTHNLGSILAATTKAVGRPMLAVDDSSDVPVPTTPWSWPTDGSLAGPYAGAPALGQGDTVATLEGTRDGYPIYAWPGSYVSPKPTKGAALPCASDYAPFGQANANAPFGFGFYPGPDAGSIAYFQNTVIAGQPSPGLDQNGYPIEAPSQYWSDRNPIRGWDYSPLDYTHYCTTGNPLCVTATFLHCPATAPAGQQVAVENCRIWNVNTILRQNQLAMHLGRKGVGTPASGAPLKWNGLDLMHSPGKQAPLDLWFVLMQAGKKLAKEVRGVHLVSDVIIAGVVIALAAGGFIAGGVLGALIAAGIAVMSIVSPDAWKKIWGVVSCGSEPDKCMAQMAAKGMAFSSGLVAAAATHTAYPQMSGPTSKVFNQIAGLSAILVMILFLLALAWAVFTGRVGQIIPSTLGLLRWGIAMGAGASVLTLAFTASDLVAQAIAGSDVGGPAGSLGSLGQAATRIAIGVGGRAGYLEWIVVALVCLVGMVCALVVWVVVFLTSQFIPFVLAVMLLQYAGQAGSEKARTWSSIGWVLLWTILLLRPIIALIAKMAQVRSLEEGMQGLLTVTAMLAIAALAPGLVSKWFPTAASSAMGIMQRLGGAAQDIDAGSRVARRMGAAAAGGASRAGSLGRMLGGGNSMGGFGPGGGPGGGNAGSVRKAPTGPSTPTGGSAAGTASAGKSDVPGAGARGAATATTGSGQTAGGGAAAPGAKTGDSAPPTSGAGDRNWAPPIGDPVAVPAPTGETTPQQSGADGSPTTTDDAPGAPISDADTTEPTVSTDAERAEAGRPAGSQAARRDGQAPPSVSGDSTGMTERGTPESGPTKPEDAGTAAGRHSGGGTPAAGAAGRDAPQFPVPTPAPRHATPPADTAVAGGAAARPSGSPVPASERPMNESGSAGMGAPIAPPPVPSTPASSLPVPLPPARLTPASSMQSAAETPGAAGSAPAPGPPAGNPAPAGGQAATSSGSSGRRMPAPGRPDEPPTRGDQGTWAPRLGADPDQPASRPRLSRNDDRNGSAR